MKAVARSYLWWPGLDEELEKFARKLSLLSSCQEFTSASTSSLMAGFCRSIHGGEHISLQLTPCTTLMLLRIGLWVNCAWDVQYILGWSPETKLWQIGRWETGTTEDWLWETGSIPGTAHGSAGYGSKSETSCAMGVRSYWRETRFIAQLWKHHLDHLHIRGDEPVPERDSQQQDSEWNFVVSPEQPPTSSETSGRSDTSAASTLTQPVNCCYPQRERQPLNRYMWTFLYMCDCTFLIIFVIMCYMFCHCLPVLELTWVFVGEECGVCKTM